MIFAFMGTTELLIVAVVIVILFGATKLPQLGDGLGKGIRNFRQALNAKDEPPALEEKTETSKEKQAQKTTEKS